MPITLAKVNLPKYGKPAPSPVVRGHNKKNKRHENII